MSDRKKNSKHEEKGKESFSRRKKGEKADEGFDDSIDWDSIPVDIENLRFARDKPTKEGSHKWWINWSDKAFQPPFPGSTDFLTIESFLNEGNQEIINALKKWVQMNNELLELIEKAVGGKEISRMAFQDQQCFVDYVEMKIIEVLKKVKNLPLKVLNDEMLEMLFGEKDNDNIDGRVYFWVSQAVHLVKHIARCTEFYLMYTPHLDLRNFEVTTFWKEYSGEAQPYGKNPEIVDYSMNLTFDDDDD